MNIQNHPLVQMNVQMYNKCKLNKKRLKCESVRCRGGGGGGGRGKNKVNANASHKQTSTP
jgi:hypothetical protein